MTRGVDFAPFWTKVEALIEERKESVERLRKKVPTSKSTWHSYKRWFTGKGEGPKTSPTVQFLGRLTELLDVTLVLDLDIGSVVTQRSRGNLAALGETMSTLDNLLSPLTPEQRSEVERAIIQTAVSKIVGFAKNPAQAGVESGPSAPAGRRKK